MKPLRFKPGDLVIRASSPSRVLRVVEDLGNGFTVLEDRVVSTRSIHHVGARVPPVRIHEPRYRGEPGGRER